MLRRFLYLDTSALNDYVSGLEGGLRETYKRLTSGTDHPDRNTNNSSELKELLTEESITMSDTPQARFERLLRLAYVDQEAAEWITVTNPDEDFDRARPGSMIEADFDVYVPDAIRMMSPAGGLPQVLDQLDALMPSAEALGLEVPSGMPSRQERNAMKGFVESLGSDLVMVGESDESDWKVAGQLQAGFLASEIDGRARVIGKVSAIWQSEEWKPLLALPGSSLLPRKQRRALSKKKPTEDEEDQFLEGPAMMLDVLAIYR
ncbi:hypothetical protein [Actinomadura sp. K4S16]|uniref:DUF6414 family protein n=1 Tax=Actinomadura sp. K4S16 TaxID=1316147 RepID=UPI0011ED1295|nr:hypothetical protein [Actinomadura sp. K4S16]